MARGLGGSALAPDTLCVSDGAHHHQQVALPGRKSQSFRAEPGKERVQDIGRTGLKRFGEDRVVHRPPLTTWLDRRSENRCAN